MANRTRALGTWIDDGNTNIPSAYRTPAASIESSATSANLTEAQVNDVLQSVYEETGSVKTFSLLCGPNLKKRFKDFTQTQFASTNVASAIKVYNQTMDSKKIITVDIYEGDLNRGIGAESLAQPRPWFLQYQPGHLRESAWLPDHGSAGNAIQSDAGRD